MKKLFVIGFLFLAFTQCSKDECICETGNESAQFIIEMKGGGGYYTETILKFECSSKPVSVFGKGYSDAEDELYHLR